MSHVGAQRSYGINYFIDMVQKVERDKPEAGVLPEELWGLSS